MTCTDPIADMLTRIRNGLMANKQEVGMPSSSVKLEILRIMQAEGFITGFTVSDEGSYKQVKVVLKYGEENERVINGLDLVSKPSLRIYAGWRKMPRVRDGLGIAVVSTSQGVMTAEGARNKKIGGEVICKIW